MRVDEPGQHRLQLPLRPGKCGHRPEVLTRHLGQPEFEVAGASQGFEAFLAPQLLAAPSQHGGDDDEKKRQACAGKEDLGEAEGLAGDLEDGLVKGHKRQSR